MSEITATGGNPTVIVFAVVAVVIWEGLRSLTAGKSQPQDGFWGSWSHRLHNWKLRAVSMSQCSACFLHCYAALETLARVFPTTEESSHIT